MVKRKPVIKESIKVEITPSFAPTLPHFIEHFTDASQLSQFSSSRDILFFLKNPIEEFPIIDKP